MSLKRQIIACVYLIIVCQSYCLAEDYPPQYILQELETRLLQKPDCLPYCATIQTMDLEVYPDRLRMSMQVHMADDVAIPLPGSIQSWRPESIMIDNLRAKSLYRDSKDVIWAFIEKGIHGIVLTGNVPEDRSFYIAIHLKPKKTNVQAIGWDIQGILPDGQIEAGIQLTRKQTQKQLSYEGITQIPPFFTIHRKLILGYKWKVETTIERITPLGAPVSVKVPLLQGESITNLGIHVKDQFALITLRPNQAHLTWNSNLTQMPSIQLIAPQSDQWVETWMLDIGTLWHCDLTGIPVVHHQESSGKRMPTWRPYPGETVTITVTQPKAIVGQTLTIDDARLDYWPGRQLHKSILTLSIRTSQGGHHMIHLPDQARIQQITINGQSIPIQETNALISLPLQPGHQSITIEWQDHSSENIYFKTPKIKLNHHAVNANITVHLNRDQWIIWARGPILGPAVLFWSYVMLIIILSIALGKVHWIPLKTRHWFLLGLGLTQIPVIQTIGIIGWFFAMALRQQRKIPTHWLVYNAIQLGLLVWSVIACSGLYFAIQKGLLGLPDMQINGNESTPFLLNWTQDHITDFMPQPCIICFPLFVYRGIMLIWAIWLAHHLLLWFKWGWSCLTCEQDLFKKIKPKIIKTQ